MWVQIAFNLVFSFLLDKYPEGKLLDHISNILFDWSLAFVILLENQLYFLSYYIFEVFVASE